jgi:hypothetical protein
VRVVERVEQAITMGRIKGSTMDSRTVMRDESEDGSQVGDFSCVSSLIVTSTAQISLSRLTSLCHSSLSTSICWIPNLLPRLRQISCNHRFLGGIIQTRDVNIIVGSLAILVEHMQEFQESS